MIIKKGTKLGHYVACKGEKRNSHRIWPENLKEKIPLERTKHKWENYIAMDLKRIG
jgi:hypothetical protein